MLLFFFFGKKHCSNPSKVINFLFPYFLVARKATLRRKKENNIGPDHNLGQPLKYLTLWKGPSLL